MVNKKMVKYSEKELSGLGITKLKEIAKLKGIKGTSTMRSGDKARLIKIILAADTSSPRKSSSSSPGPDKAYTKKDLLKLGITKLKAIARSMNITGLSALRSGDKDLLISKILKAHPGDLDHGFIRQFKNLDALEKSLKKLTVERLRELLVDAGCGSVALEPGRIYKSDLIERLTNKILECKEKISGPSYKEETGESLDDVLKAIKAKKTDIQVRQREEEERQREEEIRLRREEDEQRQREGDERLWREEEERLWREEQEHQKEEEARLRREEEERRQEEEARRRREEEERRQKEEEARRRREEEERRQKEEEARRRREEEERRQKEEEARRRREEEERRQKEEEARLRREEEGRKRKAPVTRASVPGNIPVLAREDLDAYKFLQMRKRISRCLGN